MERKRTSEGEAKLRKLEEEVEGTIDTIWQCMVQVHDLSNETGKLEQSQKSLHANLNNLMENIERVHKVSQDIDDKIPLEVVHRVDRGQNPDTVMKNHVQQALTRNLEARTRVFGAHALESTLSEYMKMWDADEKVSLNK
mmetsp:Transcript_2271/g.3192  ORF Transcript_2271/g.3192 Transcript_2271/m.3192 type:complete len:140 (+) Transcript_2271:101-520(+)